MKIKSEEYNKLLWEYFREKGGVPKEYGAIAAHGWFLLREEEFKERCKKLGIPLEPEDALPPKPSGGFKW